MSSHTLELILFVFHEPFLLFSFPSTFSLQLFFPFITLCVRQNHGSPKEIHMLIPGVCEYAALHVTRDFTDMISLRTLRWGGGVCPDGLDVIMMVIKSGGRRQQRRSEWCGLSAQLAVLDYEGGRRGPGAERCRRPLKGGNGQETDFPLEPLERNDGFLTPAL